MNEKGLCRSAPHQKAKFRQKNNRNGSSFLGPEIIALLLLVAESSSTSLAIPLCYRATLLDHQRSPLNLHTDLLMHRSATNVPR